MFSTCRSSFARKSACLRLAIGIPVAIARVPHLPYHLTSHNTLFYSGMAAAIRNLHSSGVAVIATRRDDILVNATSFELKMMPSVGSLISHAAAHVAETYCDDSVKHFVDFLQFVRPMMSCTMADGGSAASSDGGCEPLSDSHNCSRDKWDFASEHVMFALRFVELDDEILKHSEVHIAL